MNPDLLIVMSPIIVLTVTMCACFFVMFVATLVSSFQRGEEMGYKFDLHEVVYIPHEAEWGRVSTRSMDDGKPVYTVNIDHGFGWRKLAEHLLWSKEEKEATMPTPEFPPVPQPSLGENPASADAFSGVDRIHNAESAYSAGEIILPKGTPTVIDRSHVKRESFVDEAVRIVRGNREGVYGSPTKNFETTAAMWEAFLNARPDRIVNGKVKIDAVDVADLQVLLKMARLGNNQTHRDSRVDVVGYVDCSDTILGAKA